jgi:hypothetical protein
LRALLLTTAATGAAVTLYAGFTLPPARISLAPAPPPTHVTGAYHIHTVRSDGTGTVDDVAEAARENGLAFVVITDHGDGMRPPLAPSYRHGVLCIDAVEIGTDGGHVVGLGLAQPSPYPLGGRPDDVVEDIHRLGGVAIAAHPDSPRASLRWRGQTAPIDGIEWLNVDSEWRDETWPQLGLTTVKALFRPAETIASLFQRPARTLRRWDALARRRATFGIAAVDAHARIGWGDDERPGGASIARPSYRTIFGTVSQTVVLEAPLTGDPVTDAARIVHAIRTGRSFSIVQASAGPADFQFTAIRGGETFQMGDRRPVGGGAATITATVPQAPGARISILRDGIQIATGSGLVMVGVPDGPGVYRAEATLPGSALPWLMSNPIVFEEPPASREVTARSTGRTIAVQTVASAWAVERGVSSDAKVSEEADGLRVDYRLGTDAEHGPYAAIATNISSPDGIDRIEFVGRASVPMRVSLQLRLPGGPEGQRWRKSVYLDRAARPIVVRLEELEPVGVVTTRRPVVVPVRSLLFVVDTLNTAAGTSGAFWISGLALGLGQLPN